MYQLKTRQICFFLIAFMTVTKIFSLPSLLARFSNEDMWLSALISILIEFITLIPIIFACKFANKNFLAIMEDCFGKKFAKFLAILYFIYFFVKTILPLNEQKDYVDFTLYTLNSTYLYFMPIFFLAFYLCFKKLKVLGRISDVLWLVTINGFSALFILSLSNADFSAILPVGARGARNIFLGSFNSMTWFGDAVYILFFIGEFKYEKKSGLKIILSFLVSSVIILAFMIIFYSIFSSLSYRQRFALTEISKYTTVINNLGRFDYLGIIMILFSTMFAICLPIFFSSKLLEYIFNLKKSWIAPLVSVGLQVVILVFFNQYLFTVQNIIVKYFSFYFILLANLVPILLSLKIIKEKKYEIKKS